MIVTDLGPNASSVLVALLALLGIIVTMICNYAVARTSTRNREKLEDRVRDDVVAPLAAVQPQLQAVHVAVNGGAAAMRDELQAMRAELELAKRTLAERELEHQAALRALLRDRGKRARIRRARRG